MKRPRNRLEAESGESERGRKSEVHQFEYFHLSCAEESRQGLPEFWREFLRASDEAKKYDIDLVDALTLQLMKREKIDEIDLDDNDFDGVEWVKRVFQ